MVAQFRPNLIVSESHGERLDNLCKTPMEVQRFLSLAIRIAGAVSTLHQNNIIHKDIKPANIWVDLETGEVQIVDSAISTRAPRERHIAQNPSAILATLAYMSPEQTGRMNRMLDYRTDLYSLGVTLYEMLTGHLPFQANTALEWVYCHIAQTPSPPVEIVPHLPQSISDIVMCLLAKMAEDRYPSAHALIADLEECLTQWQATGTIIPFKLGTHDVPDRFHIPQRLYGREHEVTELRAAFQRMVEIGTPEFVLVSGYSGIGKSSAVNELRKPVLEAHGAFLTGKFDQYRRDIPYATITEAVRGLVQQVLAGSETEVKRWKQRLEEALEGDGQLIIGIIPQVELILGKQPSVPDMPPLQAQHRFQRVFGRFLGVFAAPEHPLALFLDDLQWADAASLDLMEHLLTRAETTHLLVIGAYRENEVSATHPLIKTVEAIRNTLPLREIRLGPLDHSSLCLLVTDTLRCTPADAEPLVALIQDKTAGNPFFTEQFLSMLYRDAYIWFDYSRQQWRWDMARIRAANVTNNVVELMADQIASLEPEAREVLKMAACIGNRFDLDTLVRVMNLSQEHIDECLGAATRSGLLLWVSDGTLGPSHEATAVLSTPESASQVLSWLHDRVQQAAYSLISAQDLPGLHLTIGRTLRNGEAVTQLDLRLFDIANHLNAAVDLITAPDERLDLAEINLAAGRKAKASAAFSSALAYFTMGQSLLGSESWEAHYELMAALTIDRARCAWTCGQLDVAEEQIAVLRNQAKGQMHRAEVFSILVNLQNTRGNIEQAAHTVLAACVELCGIDLPLHPTDEALRHAAERTWRESGDHTIEDLLHLPTMTDPGMRAVMAFLSASLPIAYFTDPRLHDLMCCHIVSLSLRYGNSNFTAHGYACFGATLGRLFKMWGEAYRFGQLALNLVELHGLPHGKTVVYFVVGVFIHSWVRHLREALPIFLKSHTAAIECGDINTACIAANQIVLLRFAMGDPLAQVAEEAEQQLELAAQAKHQVVHLAISGIAGCVQTLRTGSAPHFPSFQGELEEAAFEAQLKMQSVNAWALTYWAHKSLVQLLFGHPEAAVAAALEGAQIRDGSAGMMMEAEYCFYAALALANQIERVAPERQTEYLETLNAHQEQYRLWQIHGPENFRSRYTLISAEIASLQGRDLAAMHHYAEAIRSAQDNGFVSTESIANERAARFYLARGFETSALAHLREARSGYLRWGVDGKVKHLEREFPALAEQQKTTATTTVALHSEQLDTMAAVKASQAISGQIVFSQLLETLMQTVIEQAGAQRGTLLLLRDGQLWIEAETGAPYARIVQSQRAETSASLPQSLLSYVRRTGEKVILADATQQSLFSSDAYIQRVKPKSILCVPLLRQGQLMGMVYLENNLASNAFTSDRTAVLELLASQAAISLQNALLYEELEQQAALKVSRLEEAVQERTHEIQSQKADLEVANARLSEAVAQLESLATTDGLTGLKNHRAFQDRLKDEFDRASRYPSPLSVILLDVDRFKHYNDTYGHPAGDAVLKQLSLLLQKEARKTDIVARYGGEEFILILPETGAESARELAERLRAAVASAPWEDEGITASFGVATSTLLTSTPQLLVTEADRALYRSKNHGRNCVTHAADTREKDPVEDPTLQSLQDIIRLYRKHLEPEKIHAYLVDQVGAHFEPRAVEMFLKMLDLDEEALPGSKQNA